MKIIETLLSLMFPVRLPKVELEPSVEPADEQGSVGKPKHKLYRDALERHWEDERNAYTG
jgi:hypothetical protein